MWVNGLKCRVRKSQAINNLWNNLFTQGPAPLTLMSFAYGVSLSLVGFATFLHGRVPWGPTSSNPNGLAMFQSGMVPYGAGGRVPWGPTSSNPNGLAMFQSGMVPYGAHSVVHGRSDPLSSWTTSRIMYTCDVSRFTITLQINRNTRTWGCYRFVHFGVANDILFFGCIWIFSLFFPTSFWNNTKLRLNPLALQYNFPGTNTWLLNSSH
jgi:hypothetical protein